MSEYFTKVAMFFDFCGNEFTTQLLLVALVFIPALPRRKYFLLSYPLSLAVIIAVQVLRQFGIISIPNPQNFFVVAIMLSVTVFINFKSNVMQALFVSTCIYCVQHIVSNISWGVIYGVIDYKKSWGMFQYYYAIMPVMMFVGMLLAYFILVKILNRKSELKFNNLIILYASCLFVYVATTITYYARTSIYMPLGIAYMLLIATFFTISTLMVGFLNISKVEVENENIILQELLRKDESRYKQAKLSNEKISIKYHDMQQRTNQGIVDWESLKEVESDSEIIRSIYFTGNRALDVTLSEKALMCQRLGIRFICTADGTAIDFMKPHHIYSLLGNALENAIESLEKEQDDAAKELVVSIIRSGESCVIKTENFISKKVEIVEGRPVSTKEDKENHGFGIKSMSNVVANYGGFLDFFIENNIFTMVAIIPIA